MLQSQLAKKEIESDSVKVSSTSSDGVAAHNLANPAHQVASEASLAYGAGQSHLLYAAMTKTLPVQKDSAKSNFFSNFVIESVDQEGRTSLRQIVSTDK